MTTNKFNDFSIPIPITQGGTGAIDASDARANLGITIGSRTILGTANQINVTNGTGLLGNPQLSIATDPIMPGVGSITVPTGSVAQRPGSPTIGMIRANTDTGFFEVYSGGAWVPTELYVPGTPVVSQQVTVSHTGLATGGHVLLINSINLSATYRISNIIMNGISGTNFSGGGGDRDLVITDASRQWTIIPAATLQALSNAVWGSSNVPFPVSVDIGIASIPGQNVYAAYINGTTDYSAGSFVLGIEYTRLT